MAITPIKFSGLTARAAPMAATDIIPVVVDPSGTPLSRAATKLQMDRLVSYTFATLPSAATLGAGTMIYLTDGGDGLPCAAMSDGTNWWPVGLPTWDVGMFFPGNPSAASQLFQKVLVTRTIIFPANFAGAFGDVGVNPAATFAIDVQDDGVSIGTVSISTSGVFTFTTVSGTAKTVADGSVLEFIGPVAPDASIEDLAFTLAARQTVTS